MAHLEVENEKLKRQIEGLQGLLIVAKDCTNNQKAEIKERDELLEEYASFDPIIKDYEQCDTVSKCIHFEKDIQCIDCKEHLINRRKEILGK